MSACWDTQSGTPAALLFRSGNIIIVVTLILNLHKDIVFNIDLIPVYSVNLVHQVKTCDDFVAVIILNIGTYES